MGLRGLPMTPFFHGARNQNRERPQLLSGGRYRWWHLSDPRVTTGGAVQQQLSFPFLAKRQRQESEAVVAQKQHLFCERLLMMSLVPPIWGR